MSKERQTISMKKEWQIVERIMKRLGLSRSAAVRYIINQFEEQQTGDEQDQKEDGKERTAPT